MSAAIVMGASGGIGSEVARRLRRRGLRILLAGRNEERLQKLSEELSESQVFVGDLTDEGTVEDLFQRAQASFGTINTTVNCVGSILLKPAHLTSSSEFMGVLQTNLLSAFLCVRNSARIMNTGVSVVLVSSCAAQIGLPNHEAIASAKAGIEGLTRSAAATYAARGMRINCVAPGLVKTELTQRITGNSQAEAYSRALHPLGRLGEPSDVAAAIEFLASPEASWITGQVLGVDGGLSHIKAKAD